MLKGVDPNAIRGENIRVFMLAGFIMCISGKKNEVCSLGDVTV